MSQKFALLTGADSGIGLVAAQKLAAHGYAIAIIARNKEKANRALSSLPKVSHDKHRLFLADVGEKEQLYNAIDSIRETYDHLDLLVNNAGLMSTEMLRTSDGMEMHLAVHCRAPFILSNSLLDKLHMAEAARIINTSSALHLQNNLTTELTDLNFEVRKYSVVTAYANSKAGTVIFANEMGRRLNDLPIGISSLHPGVVNTNLFSNVANMNVLTKVGVKLMSLFIMSPEQGAKGLLMLAEDERFKGQKGIYLNKDRVAEPHKITRDQEVGKKFWRYLEAASGLTTMI